METGKSKIFLDFFETKNVRAEWLRFFPFPPHGRR